MGPPSPMMTRGRGPLSPGHQRVDGSAQPDDDLGKGDLVHGSQADLSLDLDLPLEDDREVTEEAVEDEGEELDPDDSLDPMLGTRQNVSSLVG